MRRLVLAFVVAFVGLGSPAAAHPAPFSFVDVRVQASVVRVSVVAHVFDVAHDLGIAPIERLLDPAVLRDQDQAIRKLVGDRLALTADGAPLTIGEWSATEPLAERQSLRLEGRVALARPAGAITVSTVMFPYDPQHQTFINVYEGEALASQAILDAARTQFEYFAGTRQGAFAVVRAVRAVGRPSHPDRAGSPAVPGRPAAARRHRCGSCSLVVTAFTIAHSITLSLAALNIFTPPASIVEPAIARASSSSAPTT